MKTADKGTFLRLMMPDVGKSSLRLGFAMQDNEGTPSPTRGTRPHHIAFDRSLEQRL